MTGEPTEAVGFPKGLESEPRTACGRTDSGSVMGIGSDLMPSTASGTSRLVVWFENPRSHSCFSSGAPTFSVCVCLSDMSPPDCTSRLLLLHSPV